MGRLWCSLARKVGPGCRLIFESKSLIYLTHKATKQKARLSRITKKLNFDYENFRKTKLGLYYENDNDYGQEQLTKPT